jgi:hypothetical protein
LGALRTLVTVSFQNFYFRRFDKDKIAEKKFFADHPSLRFEKSTLDFNDFD